MRERISGLDWRRMRSFVIAVESGSYDADGTPIAMPVGVEVADSQRHAFENAVRRWPLYRLVAPYPWEAVPPEIRLNALNADRFGA